MATFTPKTIKDLKGASYNPRLITDKQLKNLQASMERFGDLSGVVFNVAQKVLVSGHQRIKTLRGKKTKIVKHKVTDSTGTVALGHIEVYEEGSKEPIKIPYREVNWSDRLGTMAANVAANMAGGTFDSIKLGKIMHELERNKFDIELTSVDTWDMGKAIGKFKKSLEGAAAVKDGGSGAGTGEEFEDVDPRAMKFAHTCPRCKFKFGDAK